LRSERPIHLSRTTGYTPVTPNYTPTISAGKGRLYSGDRGSPALHDPVRPNPLQIVEDPDLPGKEMDHEIPVIKEHPAPIGEALGVARGHG